MLPPFEEFDESNSPRLATTVFEDLADHGLSQPKFLDALGAACLAAGTMMLTPLRAHASSRLSFKPVAARVFVEAPRASG